MSELIWIAVPGGRPRPDGRTPVSLVVVPRLTGGGDLTSHGMDRWPELLRATQFAFEVRGVDDPIVDVVMTFDASLEVMVARWDAVFGAAEQAVAGVRPHTVATSEGRAGTAVEITPTTAEATGLQAVYALALAGLDPSVELAELSSHVARRQAAQRRARGTVRDAGDGYEYDFHRLVALYREHPRVGRALGLVVDAAVALPANATAIRVRPTLPPWPRGTAPTLSKPWTVLATADGRVVAAPRPAGTPGQPPSLLTRRGMVDLRGAGPAGSSPNPNWAVVTYDVGAAMGHLPDTAASTPAADLPALRSAGLALVRTGHAVDVTAAVSRSNAEGSVSGVDLFADDLVLGYRVDVRDEMAPRWSRVAGRLALYSIDGQALDEQPIVEEGHVKPNAVISDASGVLTNDEVIARWDGWSLAVGRPIPGGARRTGSASALDWRFDVERPLPRLRFGHSYRLRARTVDLAGGGLSPDEAGPSANPVDATAPIFFGRVEPIPAPLVEATGPLGFGEAVERIVVRSLGGPQPAPPEPDDPIIFIPDPDDLRIEPPTFPLPVGPFPNTSTRSLVPPPVSVELAEQHGVFDGMTPEASWPLAMRAMPDLARASGEPPLPDPAAVRWHVRFPFGHVQGGWTPVAGGDAHAPAPVTLTVRRNMVWPSFDSDGYGMFADSSNVVVVVPMGGETTIDVSSSPDLARLDELALPRWISPEHARGVSDRALDGDHPHITPRRSIHVVHAVQRPLRVPRGSPGAERRPGDTSVRITGISSMFGDSRTTGQLELVAGWREWGDAPVPIGVRTAHVATVTVPARPPFDVPVSHELGDTRRRTIGYTPRAVSRFVEYFDPTLLADDPNAFSVIGPAHVVEVPSSARPPAPAIRHVTPAFSWEGPPPTPGWQSWSHVRRGGLVRVHMSPGWFASGEGELLGLVVSRDPMLAPKLWPLISQAGRDPTQRTTPAIHLVSPASVGPMAGVAVDVALPEAERPVTVVPVQPWSDPSGAGWLADVDLRPLAGSSYGPFVELALCRYQPVSIDGCHLSTVVRSEMLQLLPDRELSVQRWGDSYIVTLSGIGPVSADATSRVIVTVERWRGSGAPTTDFSLLPNAVGAAPAVDAWMPIGEPVVGDLDTWITFIASPDGAPHRLVVREVEPERRAPPQPGSTAVARAMSHRVVFADIVPL